MKRFLLFPGQGSQKPGMGQDFYEQSSVARDLMDRAANVLGTDFLKQVFTADQETLNQTRLAQPALVVVEVAVAKHLAAAGCEAAGCAGHSLGEISALVAAGACGFEDALAFTRERARLMSEDVPEGGMAAVMGLNADAIEAALPEGVQVGNFNGPSQTIITGSKEGIEQATAALKDAGAKRVLPLKVSGAFHSVLMQPAAEAFREVLAEVNFRTPEIPFISSVSGQGEGDPERIRGLLGDQLANPVRWTQVMAAVGSQAAVETGPGTVLKGLAKRMEGAPQVEPAGTWDAVRALEDAV